MYTSLIKTATYHQHVEVVAWHDDDDETRFDYPYQDRVDLNYITGERQLLSACWNDCAKEARGEIFMHMGDDVTFDTPGWDVTVRAAFAAVPDKILFAYGNDLGPHGETFGTHGFVHRRWVDAIGYFLPPLFSSDWNDVWLNEVAEQIGRKQLLPFVTEHHHYTFGKAERDQTHHEREERGTKDDVVNLYKRTAKERKKDAARLRRVMA
jgi:NADPH:quinone reductase-like Zn-dependent oxidoreductase